MWETVIDVNGEEFDIMFELFGNIKRVITHFFSNETIMEDMFRQVLVMSLVTDYTDDGAERQVRSQKELSYFDFRELNFGQTYLDTFNVADCVTDPAERRYFDIFIKHIGLYRFPFFPSFLPSPPLNSFTFHSCQMWQIRFIYVYILISSKNACMYDPYR